MSLQIDEVIRALSSSRPEIVAGATILIDGIDYSGRFGPAITTTHDADASFASASFEVLVPFSLPEGFHVIDYRAGWKKPYATAFKGEIVQRGRTYYKQHDTLQAAGVLRRTQVGLDVQMGFYNTDQDPARVAACLALIPAGYEAIPIVTDADIIIKIIETYGITPSTWNHQIHASELFDRDGTPYQWKPAQILPILWEPGRAGWEIISKLDKATAFRTFDGPAGAVYRRQTLGLVPAGVRATFHQGTEILDLSLVTTFDVYNQVVVTGHDLASLTALGVPPTDTANPADPGGDMVTGISPNGSPWDSPYIPDPPRVRTNRDISVEYLEFYADADAIADIMLGFLQDPYDDISLTTFGCPDFNVGDAIRITSAVLELDVKGWIVTHTLSQSPLRSVMQIRASTSPDSRGNSAPIAAFVVALLLEHLIIDGVLTPVVLVTVDATASTDSDGSIVSYQITVGAETVTITPPNIPIVTLRYVGPSPIPVSVSVVDNEGLSGTLGQEVPFDPATLLSEPLVAAEATDGAASIDAEASWLTFAGTGVNVVAPIALGSITCWSQGAALWGSHDYLQTPPALLHTFPSAITALWNNEQLTDRWIAGLQSGDVWLSIDAAVTWTRLGNVAVHPVNDIAESPFLAGQISAACGDAVYQTFDGRHWAALIVGIAGTALRFAAGLYGGVSYLYGGFSDGKLYRWQNDTGAYTLLGTLAGGEIRGLTLAILKHELYAFMSGPLTYAWDFSVEPSPGPEPGPDTPTATNYAIRSGTGTWVYLATDGALGKYFPRDAYFDMRLLTSPQEGLRIGYGAQGPIVAPPVVLGPVEVYLPTNHFSSLGGVWHYVPASGWTRQLGGLPTSIDWWWIAASPFDPNVLAVIGTAVPYIGYPDQFSNDTTNHLVKGSNGKSPVWISTNGGATWTEAPCRAPTEATGSAYGFYQIEFSKTTPGRWYVVGRTETAAGLRVTRWSGDLTTPRNPFIDTKINHDWEWSMSGDAEDTLTSYHDGAFQIVYVNTPEVITGLVETVNPRLDPRPTGPDKPNMDLNHGTRHLFALEGWRSDGNRLWYVDDYRSGTVFLTDQTFPRSSGSSAGYVTCTVDAAYISQGDGTYEIKVIPPPPRPYSYTVHTTRTTVAERLAQVRADRQHGRVVAGRGTGDATKIVIFDGTSWGRFDGPPEATGNMNGCIEVVTRAAT